MKIKATAIALGMAFGAFIWVALIMEEISRFSVPC